VRELRNEIVTGINSAMACVKGFHTKLQVCPTQRLSDPRLKEVVDEQLYQSALSLKGLADKFERMLVEHSDDERVARAQLVVEEIEELLMALSERDEVETLDALADALYVIKGTAVTLDLPLAEGFVEAHESNMTKTKQEDDPSKARVRRKGPNYIPANFLRVLTDYRQFQLSPHDFRSTDECALCGESLHRALRQFDEHGRSHCRGVRLA